MTIQSIRELPDGGSVSGETFVITTASTPHEYKGNWTQRLQLEQGEKQIWAEAKLNGNKPLVRLNNLTVIEGTMASYDSHDRTCRKLMIDKFANATATEPPPKGARPRQGNNDVDWDAKDLRMARMNALTNAMSYSTTCATVTGDTDYLKLDKITELVQFLVEDVIYEHLPMPELTIKQKEPQDEPEDDVPF